MTGSQTANDIIGMLRHVEEEIRREREHMEANGEWLHRWSFSTWIATDEVRVEMSWVGTEGRLIHLGFSRPLTQRGMKSCPEEMKP